MRLSSVRCFFVGIDSSSSIIGGPGCFNPWPGGSGIVPGGAINAGAGMGRPGGPNPGGTIPGGTIPGGPGTGKPKISSVNFVEN